MDLVKERIMTDPTYMCLKEHYENCFEEHGDNHLGVDWPSEKDALTRYKVMLDLIKYDQSSRDCSNLPMLLDIGCGAGHFLSYLKSIKGDGVNYTGLDISEIFVKHCREKFPRYEFIMGDILSDDFVFAEHEYALMNGVFTEKRGLTQEAMFSFFSKMIFKAFASAKRGIAFNVMSKNVDWERDDLFHLSLDRLTQYLVKNLSRHFVIRNDYGLYEYTVYVYHQPAGGVRE